MCHPANDLRLAKEIFAIGLRLSIWAKQFDSDIASQVAINSPVDLTQTTTIMEPLDV
jgi:hypothetical protein